MIRLSLTLISFLLLLTLPVSSTSSSVIAQQSERTSPVTVLSSSIIEPLLARMLPVTELSSALTPFWVVTDPLTTLLSSVTTPLVSNCPKTSVRESSIDPQPSTLRSPYIRLLLPSERIVPQSVRKASGCDLLPIRLSPFSVMPPRAISTRS